MGAVVGVFVALGLLAVVGWAAAWSAAGDRPTLVGSEGSAHDEAVMIAIGVERAERVVDLGRHDERRCGF